MSSLLLENSTLACYAVEVITVFVGYYVNYVYQLWEKAFSSERVKRTNTIFLRRKKSPPPSASWRLPIRRTVDFVLLLILVCSSFYGFQSNSTYVESNVSKIHHFSTDKSFAVALEVHRTANTSESGSDALKMHHKDSEVWEERLFTATFVTRCGGLYFIVDCWHHRILYSDRWSFNLSDFASIDKLRGPHSVACNNRIVMMEDTGYHKVRAYSLDDLKSGLQNRKEETIEYTEFKTSIRPHRTVYDEKTAAFYVITKDNHFYKYTDNGTNITQVAKTELNKLGPKCGYSRSFVIADEELLVCCSTGKIKRYTFGQGVYEFIGAYPAPSDLNDVYHSSSGWWYVTNTFDGFWRVRSLEELAVKGKVIGSQAGKLGFRGVPYYVSEVDGVLVVPQIASPRKQDESAIVTFRESSDPTEELEDKLVVLDAGRPKEVDKKRKGSFAT